jgi:hypothetical protein
MPEMQQQQPWMNNAPNGNLPSANDGQMNVTPGMGMSDDMMGAIPTVAPTPTYNQKTTERMKNDEGKWNLRLKGRFHLFSWTKHDKNLNLRLFSSFLSEIKLKHITICSCWNQKSLKFIFCHRLFRKKNLGHNKPQNLRQKNQNMTIFKVNPRLVKIVIV